MKALRRVKLVLEVLHNVNSNSPLVFKNRQLSSNYKQKILMLLRSVKSMGQSKIQSSMTLRAYSLPWKRMNKNK